MSSPYRLLTHQAGTEAARQALAAYYAELDLAFPEGFSLDVTPAAEGDEVTPPRGDFLVMCEADSEQVVGCGAIKLLTPALAEVKRMWIVPAARGRGLGREMVAALEDRARELGATTMRLDTSRHLPQARGLYLAVGYREIPAYNDNPYADHWFEKSL